METIYSIQLAREKNSDKVNICHSTGRHDMVQVIIDDQGKHTILHLLNCKDDGQKQAKSYTLTRYVINKCHTVTRGLVVIYSLTDKTIVVFFCNIRISLTHISYHINSVSPACPWPLTKIFIQRMSFDPGGSFN